MGRISSLGVPRASLLAAVAVAALVGSSSEARRVAGGTIVGVITTKEAARPAIRVTIDPAICGSTMPDESIVVDGAGHVSGAVVSIPGVKVQAPAEALIVNNGCRFVPHVSLVRPKGSVKMLSKDAVLHTMHAAAGDGKALFNVSLPIPNMTLSRPIDRVGVVTLSCSTHTWMRGYLVVTDDLAATSGADGSFKLENVPAGVVELRVWHEALKTTAPIKVTVKDGETTTVPVALVRQ
jgi:hypothetical protein